MVWDEAPQPPEPPSSLPLDISLCPSSSSTTPDTSTPDSPTNSLSPATRDVSPAVDETPSFLFSPTSDTSMMTSPTPSTPHHIHMAIRRALDRCETLLDDVDGEDVDEVEECCYPDTSRIISSYRGSNWMESYPMREGSFPEEVMDFSDAPPEAIMLPQTPRSSLTSPAWSSTPSSPISPRQLNPYFPLSSGLVSPLSSDDACSSSDDDDRVKPRYSPASPYTSFSIDASPASSPILDNNFPFRNLAHYAGRGNRQESGSFADNSTDGSAVTSVASKRNPACQLQAVAVGNRSGYLGGYTDGGVGLRGRDANEGSCGRSSGGCDEGTRITISAAATGNFCGSNIVNFNRNELSSFVIDNLNNMDRKSGLVDSNNLDNHNNLLNTELSSIKETNNHHSTKHIVNKLDTDEFAHANFFFKENHPEPAPETSAHDELPSEVSSLDTSLDSDSCSLLDALEFDTSDAESVASEEDVAESDLALLQREACLVIEALEISERELDALESSEMSESYEHKLNTVLNEDLEKLPLEVTQDVVETGNYEQQLLETCENELMQLQICQKELEQLETCQVVREACDKEYKELTNCKLRLLTLETCEKALETLETCEKKVENLKTGKQTLDAFQNIEKDLDALEICEEELKVLDRCRQDLQSFETRERELQVLKSLETCEKELEQLELFEKHLCELRRHKCVHNTATNDIKMMHKRNVDTVNVKEKIVFCAVSSVKEQIGPVVMNYFSNEQDTLLVNQKQHPIEKPRLRQVQYDNIIQCVPTKQCLPIKQYPEKVLELQEDADTQIKLPMQRMPYFQKDESLNNDWVLHQSPPDSVKGLLAVCQVPSGLWEADGYNPRILEDMANSLVEEEEIQGERQQTSDRRCSAYSEYERCSIRDNREFVLSCGGVGEEHRVMACGALTPARRSASIRAAKMFSMATIRISSPENTLLPKKTRTIARSTPTLSKRVLSEKPRAETASSVTTRTTTAFTRVGVQTRPKAKRKEDTSFVPSHKGTGCLADGTTGPEVALSLTCGSDPRLFASICSLWPDLIVRLAHDISPLQSPSAENTSDPPDRISDDDRPPPLLDDNKCCADEDHCCPHVPRGTPPVPPVLSPSPEPLVAPPTPLCGAPSPRHKPALRSATSSAVNSPKRKVDFQGSPAKISTPKKARGYSRTLVTHRSVNNNDSVQSSPAHRTSSSLSITTTANNNNNINSNNCVVSPFPSPRRRRHVSVGEEIVEAFVRSCASPICGSPRPRNPSLGGSVDSLHREELEDEYAEDEEENFGCPQEEEDDCEVDDVIELEEEVVGMAVEEEEEEEEDEEEEGDYDIEVDDVLTVEIDNCEEEHREEDQCQRSLRYSEGDAMPASVCGEEEHGDHEQRRNVEEQEEKASRGDECTPKTEEGAAEARTVRRRRLLPEIPKNRKSFSRASILALRTPNLADEIQEAESGVASRSSTPENLSILSSNNRPILVLKCHSYIRDDSCSPESDPRLQAHDLDSGHSTQHSPDGLKSMSPQATTVNESLSPQSPGGSSGGGVARVGSGSSVFPQLELLEATHRGLYRFQPRHYDEIEVDIGDPIYVQKEADDLWCEGVNLRTGRQGIFPAAHVTDVDYSEFDPSAARVKKERYLLCYLGSIETLCHKGNQVLCQAVRKIARGGAGGGAEATQQPCILEVSDQGIRMLDKSRGLDRAGPCHDYFYHLKHVSFCGFHPKDHRYFGFITKHPAIQRFACHVFSSAESTRPVAEAVGRAFQRFYQKYIETAYPIEDIYLE